MFVAATSDSYLRAYDASTGVELWKGRLPGESNATPMTYALNGRQFVVVATGGTFAGAGSNNNSRRPDNTVIAFSMPQH